MRIERLRLDRIAFWYSGFFVNSHDTAHRRSRYRHVQLALTGNWLSAGDIAPDAARPGPTDTETDHDIVAVG